LSAKIKPKSTGATKKESYTPPAKLWVAQYEVDWK